MKKTVIVFMIICVYLSLYGCEFIRKPLDNKTGFSESLQQLENLIREEDWPNAQSNLKNTIDVWKKLKPFLQIDIDHDYLNSIENNFSQLKAYIETKEKSHSLAIVLLIQEDWKNIGSM